MAAVRIGNASGFYGDRFAAVREMLEGGPPRLDVLTGDYLAELTMWILARDRARDARTGYARTFLRQMEDCLALALERRVKIVVNAGGLAPARLREALIELAGRLGLAPAIAHVEGDDLVASAGELGLGAPVAATAYLGGWGIAECLRAGADVVITGRVTDASLVVGAAAAHHGWTLDDLEALAGATVAGHVIECGTQACGGNYAFFAEHDPRRLLHPGFPIAEIEADGSCVLTKHAGTGGVIDTGTITAQLLYEVAGARYAGPDVTTRLDTVELAADGPDRVRIQGARGEPPPPALKVSVNGAGGHRNEVVFVLTGLEIEAKAALVRAQLEARLAARRPARVIWTLARTDRPDAETEQTASAFLRCRVEDPDPLVVGRTFSNLAVELALASHPGFHLTAPPGDAWPFGSFRAAFVDRAAVTHVAVLPDGTRRTIDDPPATRALEDVEAPALPVLAPAGPTRRAPLGLVAGARSGDKGGAANIGVWARRPEAWPWLAHTLTSERLAELLPETAAHRIARHVLPNLRALNFVIEGLLEEGVASASRFDPQAKALGEWLRSRHLPIPESLL